MNAKKLHSEIVDKSNDYWRKAINKEKNHPNANSKAMLSQELRKCRLEWLENIEELGGLSEDIVGSLLKTRIPDQVYQTVCELKLFFFLHKINKLNISIYPHGKENKVGECNINFQNQEYFCELKSPNISTFIPGRESKRVVVDHKSDLLSSWNKAKKQRPAGQKTIVFFSPDSNYSTLPWWENIFLDSLYGKKSINYKDDELGRRNDGLFFDKPREDICGVVSLFYQDSQFYCTAYQNPFAPKNIPKEMFLCSPFWLVEDSLLKRSEPFDCI